MPAATIPPSNIDSFGRDNTAGATWAHTLSFTPGDGRLLVLAASVNRVPAPTKTISSITQAGVTWTNINRRADGGSGNYALELWYSWQVSGASPDLTINWSSATGTRGACIVAEYEAIDTSSDPYQRQEGVSATSSSISATNSDVAADTIGDLIVSFVATSASATTVSITGGDFTPEHNQQGVGSSGTRLYLSDKIAESIAKEGYTATVSPSDIWIVTSAAFTQSPLTPTETESAGEPTEVESESTEWLLPELSSAASVNSNSDYCSIGKENVIGRFRESPIFMGILETVCERANELDGVLWDIYRARDVDLATGSALDQLGKLVGEERNGSVDDVYRLRVKTRIRANLSRGRRDDIKEIAAAVFSDADSIAYQDVYPAYFELTASGTSADLDAAASMIEAAAAAGVGGLVIASSGAASETFRFASGDTFETDAARGMGDESFETGGGVLADARRFT